MSINVEKENYTDHFNLAVFRVDDCIMTENSSAIFTGHRPLGYVSNHIPLVTRYVSSRKEHLIITVTGKTFHTYGSSKLGLLSVSKIHPQDITSVTADTHLVFAAAGSDIFVWRRGNELQRVLSSHHALVHTMLPFGPKLLSVDTESVLKIWNIKTGAEELELTFNNEKTKISCLCHPSTYLDKVLVGSEQGHIQLWNIKSTKLIYTFAGWNSKVLVMEQAPAVDVVAIGLESGDIFVHNMKYDETVVKFSQDWGPVTSLSFRTDGQPVMISGAASGDLACWDLEKRRLGHQVRCCHQAAVAGVRCLAGQPVMVTNSRDNSLKQWIFDMSDGGARILRLREGHSQPPGRIRYYGALGQNILSAGQDSSLRVFSTVTDYLNRSLGHASYNRKLSKKHKVTEDPVRMPHITDFTTDTSKDREWDNIACIHRDLALTTTWSYGNSKMGELKLLHERFKLDVELKARTQASCLTLTACGNFVLVGYTSGHVDRFNIQSGHHRGTYNHGTNPAHKHPVRGVVTDGLNQQTVTADSRGIIKFWRFKAGQMLGKLMLESDLNSVRLHRDSGLMAVALENFSLRVVDIDTREVVRQMTGHAGVITDLTFSSDCRWLVSVSMDGTGRVWDLPTGHCVDWVEFDSPAVSVDLSPASDMMATSHVGDLGIYLWVNKTLYQHVSLAPLSKHSRPVRLSLPANLSVEQPSEAEDNDMEVEESEPEFQSPEQISEDLITLANLPGSRWQNLLNLDVIKAKNKPKAPPKKPKAAPFFLPTVPGLETKFDLSGVERDEREDAGTDISLGFTSFTEFGSSLGQAESEEDFQAMIQSLLEKGPSALDIEIRSLGPEGGGTIIALRQFLEMIKVGIRSNTNFEALQSYLSLFLKVHGDVISKEVELVKALRDIQTLQDEKWSSLHAEFDESLCLVKFFKSSFLV